MKRPGSASDPLWYKDAIIYELHVKAFADGNNDGIGDFAGLLQKLDYLQDLGITCIWLLPFFPSPLRDDGYDISDYLNVHPSYGTLEDFQAFLAAAHDRNLQVLIELVVNHTSDQHPWFQAARVAPPGSEERNFYVWSDTAEKYRDARIIFTDTEKSNWTWDPVAQAYYWHRFFSHQPDLNYDNPRVMEEVLRVLHYWLDMGADAIRLDAIPYLVERDGTNCENLPETHAALKRIRAEIDANYANRMILAEANQWPSDVRPYFGDGDECHMAFHFPLMPRIYMALRQEDRLPITDIMAQTPDIPETCQWGLFLRNHDELTLEMVTTDERDYMYLAYSADPRMRINLGIRRRLAPLLDNNRRRIELLNSLLFSFPGTPIIYYGDEIGMGDNIYLGDRNGVRTPMQWSGDRNAGFSRAIPAKLYSPVIMDPVFGYEAINVEAQQSDQASLLNWMRNMVALRKLFRLFGRGTLEFLHPSNRKILAYIRKYGGEQVLCVANLSRFAQPVDLDLAELEGMVPIEMLGYVEFPRITRQPYRLTLGPYGFLWLELHETPEPVSEISVTDLDESKLTLSGGLPSLFEEPARIRAENVLLPEYLLKQRWFNAKGRHINSARVADWALLEGLSAALCLVTVVYEDESEDRYFLPVAISLGKNAESIAGASPNLVISPVSTPDGDGVLHDGLLDEGVRVALPDVIKDGREISMKYGLLRGQPGALFTERHEKVEAHSTPRPCPVDQNSSSTVYGDRFILKFLRRYECGSNPEAQIGRCLSEQAHFDATPPFAGCLEYVANQTEPATSAILQLAVQNEGDAWKWTLEELDRYYEHCAPLTYPQPDPLKEKLDLLELTEQPVPELAREHIGIYLDAASGLGRRTAQMHIALASLEGSDFTPELATVDDINSLLTNFRNNATRAFDALKANLSRLPDDVTEAAGLALGRRRRVVDFFRLLDARQIKAHRARIHGNYHLGSVLRVKGDYVIIDFEADPSLPISQRGRKQSPLKDVASMLRSFSYGAYVTLLNYTARRPVELGNLIPWARLCERGAAGAFLHAYRETLGVAGPVTGEPDSFRLLLQAYLMDQALSELIYEIENHPAWARIPLEGILSLSL